MTLQQVPSRWIVALMLLLMLPLLLALGGCQKAPVVSSYEEPPMDQSRPRTPLVEASDPLVKIQELTQRVYRVDDLNRRTTCYVLYHGTYNGQEIGSISCLPATIYEEDAYSP